MQYRIEFDLTKPAFRHGEAQEVARLLRNLASALENLENGEIVETSLHDECGEVVGRAVYWTDEEWEDEPAGW